MLNQHISEQVSESSRERITILVLGIMRAKSASPSRIAEAQVKGIRVYRGKIKDNLDIWVAHNLEKVEKNNIEYIILPIAELIFQNNTVFEGDVNFSSAQFGEITSFNSAQFKGETDFSFAQFGEITYFSSAQFQSSAIFDAIKYWSDSPRVTLARWFWKDGRRDKFLKCILFLPKNSPEGEPQRPAQFYLDSQNISKRKVWLRIAEIGVKEIICLNIRHG